MTPDVAATYVPRVVDARLRELIGSLPAVMVLGPRAVGKTTTARRHAQTVVHLDRTAEAAVFDADPDAALRGLDEPVLLDEWQAVPGVLGAVKRAVDADPRPGRFLLTGSVRAELDAPTWPGTGRTVHVTMCGLTGRERFGDADQSSVVDRLLESGTDALGQTRTTLDVRDYLRIVGESGFPEVTTRIPASLRAAWLDSYVDQTVTRDAQLVEAGRDPERLRRYFEAFAANTAGIIEHKALQEAAGLARSTAVAYEQLLKNLLITTAVPAWSTNRLKRLTRLPKRYLADPALMLPLLVVDEEAILRDGDLLGRSIETFVAAQIRSEVAVSSHLGRVHHLRTKEQRREIDLIVETPRGVLALEIKAGATPTPGDARHLRWLRDQLGDRFRLGIVVHTGPGTFELDERIVAAPIAALWS